MRANAGGALAAVLAAVLAAALLSGPAVPGYAQSNEKKLETLEKRIETDKRRERELSREAKRIKSDILRIKRKLVGAASAVQNREVRVAALEKKLAKLNKQEKVIRERLTRKDKQLVGSLAVLQRLSLFPTAAVVASPGDPNRSLRQILLMRAVVSPLEARTSSLRTELDELATLGRDIKRDRSALRTTALDLDNDRKRLTKLLEEKGRLATKTEREKAEIAKHMAQLVEEAKTLKELIRRIERESLLKPVRRPNIEERPNRPRTGVPTAQITRGRPRLPVKGRIVSRFGQANEFGRSRQGVVIETPPGAQVVSPVGGRVAFAGPFRGYGQILIIEHSGGYHTLLAGFSRIDSTPDQILLAGEPVGVMGRPENGSPSLYVELREKGRPINPLPWMAARK